MSKREPTQYYETDAETAMTLRSGFKLNCFATTGYYYDILEFINNKSLIIRKQKGVCKILKSPLYKNTVNNSYCLSASRSPNYYKAKKYCSIDCKNYHKFIEITDKYKEVLRGLDNNIQDNRLYRLRKLYYTHKNKIKYLLDNLNDRISCECNNFLRRELLILRSYFKQPNVFVHSVFFTLASVLNKDVALKIISYLEYDYDN